MEEKTACPYGDMAYFTCEILTKAEARIRDLERRDGIIFVEDGATWKARAEKAEARIRDLESLNTQVESARCAGTLDQMRVTIAVERAERAEACAKEAESQARDLRESVVKLDIERNTLTEERDFLRAQAQAARKALEAERDSALARLAEAREWIQKASILGDGKE